MSFSSNESRQREREREQDYYCVSLEGRFLILRSYNHLRNDQHTYWLTLFFSQLFQLSFSNKQHRFTTHTHTQNLDSPVLPLYSTACHLFLFKFLLLNKLPAARKQDIFPFCFIFSFRKLSTQVRKNNGNTFLVIYHHPTFGVSPLKILLTAAANWWTRRRKRSEGPFASSSHGRYAQHIVLCISLYTVVYCVRFATDCLSV